MASFILTQCRYAGEALAEEQLNSTKSQAPEAGRLPDACGFRVVGVGATAWACRGGDGLPHQAISTDTPIYGLTLSPLSLSLGHLCAGVLGRTGRVFGILMAGTELRTLKSQAKRPKATLGRRQKEECRVMKGKGARSHQRHLKATPRPPQSHLGSLADW